MKIGMPHLLGCTAVLALALGASGQTGQTTPPNQPAPGSQPGPTTTTPPPGTQNDRQIPENRQNNQQTSRDQTPPSPAPGAVATESSFPEQAAKGAMTEVQFGQLAREKGSTAAVRDFGKMLVDDHSAEFNKIKGLAAKDNLTIGTEVDSSKQATYQRLASLSGKVFDEGFAEQMVYDHQQAIEDFQKEASSANRDAWRDFAKDSLPMLQKHLQEAQKLSNASPTSTSSPNLNQQNPDNRTNEPAQEPTYGRPAPGAPQPRY